MPEHSWLAHLFAEEGRQLRRFLHRFGSASNAEELAQDSFAKLCATDPGAIASPRSYLYRTARNLALNEARRRRAARIDFVGDPEDLRMASGAPSPEEQVALADELARLGRALQGLPPPHREALTLFKIEGLSHREIGARLGVSHRTVERYVADALAHCHRVLRASAD
jgi:RNA polymerase sigma factor (sigma-70 family)